ncbi:lactate utilization protein [Candidatus Parcubacteria bacterium]|nr:lactate utilization protein [Candidatus Parcubacteria bacterium]
MTYDQTPKEEEIEATVAALKERGFMPEVLESRDSALNRIKELIPKSASVMNGASVTLQEIGFIDYLKSGEHGWKNLHENILSETDSEKQAELRKHSVVSDFYLGSVHALSRSGEMVIASNTGSQLPHLAFTSQNLILVVGFQKIARDLPSALERLEKYVLPLEDKRLLASPYKSHTMHSKTLILHRENPMMGRKVHVLIIKEKLGF